MKRDPQPQFKNSLCQREHKRQRKATTMKGLNIECLNIAEHLFHSSGGRQSHNSSWDLYFLKEKDERERNK